MAHREIQPATQVDFDMSQGAAKDIYPTPDHLELLHTSRQHILRTSTLKDLCALIIRLELACEAARVAALRAMHAPVRQFDDIENAKLNFGFADLFSALRRTRAEVLSREIDRAKHAASPLYEGKVSVDAPSASKRLPTVAHQKARR